MDYECWPHGERALLLRFDAVPTAAANALVHRACRLLQSAGLPGVRAVAPAYATIVIDLNALGMRTVAQLRGSIDRLLQDVFLEEPVNSCITEIPVRYGGGDGPDLNHVAERLGFTPQAVVELHCSVDYRVAMIGFLPGFPYLLGLPQTLELPRRDEVRAQVAAGSVAIAGLQTGIYPQASPGGWHLIGRTDAVLFNPTRAPYALLQPGGNVRFVPVR